MSKNEAAGDSTWRVLCGDFREQGCHVADESADLVIVDPPYNIGYEGYDTYDDSPDEEKFLDLLGCLFAEVWRVLKPNGTFWLVIGDEQVAQARLMASRRTLLSRAWGCGSEEDGFHLRSWVVQYFTFGVSLPNNFARSHVHMLYFTKHKKKFTFNADSQDLRVPSARQLVYNDKRANPKGKLPDNTWILSPLELPAAFSDFEDTWMASRVCGTFKERADRGKYGEKKGTPQMPLKIVERMVLATSNPGDLVVDFMVGTGTTGVAAVSLGRKFFGCDISAVCCEMSRDRLRSIATAKEGRCAKVKTTKKKAAKQPATGT